MKFDPFECFLYSIIAVIGAIIAFSIWKMENAKTTVEQIESVEESIEQPADEARAEALEHEAVHERLLHQLDIEEADAFVHIYEEQLESAQIAVEQAQENEKYRLKAFKNFDSVADGVISKNKKLEAEWEWHKAELETKAAIHDIEEADADLIMWKVRKQKAEENSHEVAIPPTAQPERVHKRRKDR